MMYESAILTVSEYIEIVFQYSSKEKNMKNYELNITLFTRRDAKGEGKFRFKDEETSNLTPVKASCVFPVGQYCIVDVINNLCFLAIGEFVRT